MAGNSEPYLIVGLGNPGRQYENTRHNIGFLLVDQLVSRWSVNGLAARSKFGGEVGTVERAGRKLVLLKPSSYMNLSGGPVSQVAHFYQVKPQQVAVICDDVNLPFGMLRIRAKGGAGGHKGLTSIQQMLGSDAYVRIRVGVGGGDPGKDLSGHVLGNFPPAESKQLPKIFERCSLALETILDRNVEIAMSQYNGSALESDK